MSSEAFAEEEDLRLDPLHADVFAERACLPKVKRAHRALYPDPSDVQVVEEAETTRRRRSVITAVLNGLREAILGVCVPEVNLPKLFREVRDSGTFALRPYVQADMFAHLPCMLASRAKTKDANRKAVAQEEKEEEEWKNATGSETLAEKPEKKLRFRWEHGSSLGMSQKVSFGRKRPRAVVGAGATRPTGTLTSRREYLQVRLRPGVWEYAHRILLWCNDGMQQQQQQQSAGWWNGAPCTLHICGRPNCLQPRHLVWGTQAQNMLGPTGAFPRGARSGSSASLRSKKENKKQEITAAIRQRMDVERQPGATARQQRHDT